MLWGGQGVFLQWNNYYLIAGRIMSKQEKQNFIAHEKFCGGKIVSPHEMLCLLKKNQHNRMWILKQLSQLGIDVNLLEDYSLSDLYRHCDQIIKSTYSIKYLGMNENEMGIISRRIDPFKDNNFNLKSLEQSKYTVNKFFFPKPLKVGKKHKKQEMINIDNLESQIKKAFLKNNPSNPRVKSKNKTLVNGSWLSYRMKDKQFVESKKHKSQSVLKTMAEKDQIKIPHMTCMKKLANSYSRFLSSGLVYSSAAYDENKN